MRIEIPIPKHQDKTEEFIELPSESLAMESKDTESLENENIQELGDREIQETLLKEASVETGKPENIKTTLFNNLDKSFLFSSALFFLSSAFSLVNNDTSKAIGDKLQRTAYLSEVASWVGRGALDTNRKINPGLIIPTGLSGLSALFKSDSFIGRFSRYVTHIGNMGMTTLHSDHVMESDDEEHRPIRDLITQAKQEINYQGKEGLINGFIEDGKFNFKLAQQALTDKPQLLLETFKSLAGKGQFNIPHVHAVSTLTSVVLTALTTFTIAIGQQSLSNIFLNTLNVSPSIFSFAAGANTQNMKSNYLKKSGKFEQISPLGYAVSNTLAYKYPKFSVMVLQPIFSGIKNIASAFEAKKINSSEPIPAREFAYS